MRLIFRFFMIFYALNIFTNISPVFAQRNVQQGLEWGMTLEEIVKKGNENADRAMAQWETAERQRNLGEIAKIVLPLSIIGLVAIIIFGVYQAVTKLCPHCKSRIPKEAVVCMRCTKQV